MKVFTISSWIPKLKEPNIAFNLSPPSYQEITQIIKCMKFSGSPCPLNQISIYCFNLCPYLRPHNIPISTRNIHYDYFNSTCVIQHVRMPSNGVLPTAPPAQFVINNKSLVMSSVDAKLHC